MLDGTEPDLIISECTEKWDKLKSNSIIGRNVTYMLWEQNLIEDISFISEIEHVPGKDTTSEWPVTFLFIKNVITSGLLN